MSENLAKARAAVAPLITHDTGDRPRWRVIHTDSESPSGVALACTGENSDALHMIDDYPGGPIRDEEGVYDCCPWPQFETYSPVLAAYLVELLNADAEEKATAPAATATPDFFQPGHTYSDPSADNDWKFRVDAITTHPEDGERTALGWRHFRGEWTEQAYGEDDFEIHLLVGMTDGGDR
jgi:hypothetical protein